jgi:hypothetical protein
LPTPAFSESGALPDGLTFADDGHGAATVSGTPSGDSEGTYPVTVTTENSAGSLTEGLVVTVLPPVAITSAARATFTEGEAGLFTFTASGSPAPTFSETGRLPAGVSLSAAGNLVGTPGPDTGGTFPITVTASNGIADDVTQSFVLSVLGPPVITTNPETIFNPLVVGSYNVEAQGYPAPTFSETGPLPPGVEFTSHGVFYGTPAAGSQGAYPLTITASNGLSPDAIQDFTLYVGFVIAQTSLPGGQKGKHYVARLTTFGGKGPYRWRVSAGRLPPGLTLSGTGGMRGTPKVVGTYTFTVEVTAWRSGTNTTAFQELSITVT